MGAVTEEEMTNASGKASREQEIKAALEVIAGRKISTPVPADVINLFYVLGAYVRTLPQGDQQFPESFTTWRTLLLPPFDKTYTSDAPLLDVSGVSSTGSDGKSVFQVSAFVGSDLEVIEPINILATPRGALPFFLTVEHKIVFQQDVNDIEITVYAWDPQGNPGPNVDFYWRCRLAQSGT